MPVNPLSPSIRVPGLDQQRVASVTSEIDWRKIYKAREAKQTAELQGFSTRAGFNHRYDDPAQATRDFAGLLERGAPRPAGFGAGILANPALVPHLERAQNLYYNLLTKQTGDLKAQQSRVRAGVHFIEPATTDARMQAHREQEQYEEKVKKPDLEGIAKLRNDQILDIERLYANGGEYRTTLLALGINQAEINNLQQADIADMNARFDRMIAEANQTHQNKEADFKKRSELALRYALANKIITRQNWNAAGGPGVVVHNLTTEQELKKWEKTIDEKLAHEDYKISDSRGNLGFTIGISTGENGKIEFKKIHRDKINVHSASDILDLFMLKNPDKKTINFTVEHNNDGKYDKKTKEKLKILIAAAMYRGLKPTTNCDDPDIVEYIEAFGKFMKNEDVKLQQIEQQQKTADEQALARHSHFNTQVETKEQQLIALKAEIMRLTGELQNLLNAAPPRPENEIEDKLAELKQRHAQFNAVVIDHELYVQHLLDHYDDVYNAGRPDYVNDLSIQIDERRRFLDEVDGYLVQARAAAVAGRAARVPAAGAAGPGPGAFWNQDVAAIDILRNVVNGHRAEQGRQAAEVGAREAEIERARLAPD